MKRFLLSAFVFLRNVFLHEGHCLLRLYCQFISIKLRVYFLKPK